MLKKEKAIWLNNYTIFETDEFIRKLSKITSRQRNYIQKKLKNYIYPQLRKEPHYGNNIKKLINYKPETWRYRIGKFRVFYTIYENEKTIFILTIDFRKDVY